MHLGAGRHHPHGLLVHDQDSPLHLARGLVVIPDGVLDDIVHNFWKKMTTHFNACEYYYRQLASVAVGAL